GWLRFGQCCRELAENLPEVCREVCREFANKLSGARRVFAGRMLKVRWEFAEENRELIENSPEKFAGKFVGSSPIGYRVLAGSSPEECWEFAEGNRELNEGSSKGCREFTER
ncbi:hypothetical protein BHM03_00057628, partial [Ensete ventricosum]